jgi:hypothetical protein
MATSKLTLKEHEGGGVWDQALIKLHTVEYQSQKIFFKINKARLIKLTC